MGEGLSKRQRDLVFVLQEHGGQMTVRKLGENLDVTLSAAYARPTLTELGRHERV